VPVMAAGVHDARPLGTVLRGDELRDRQGVHIGSQQRNRPRLSPHERSEDPRLPDAGPQLGEVELPEFGGDECSSIVLYHRELGTAMEVAPDAAQVGGRHGSRSEHGASFDTARLQFFHILKGNGSASLRYLSPRAFEVEGETKVAKVVSMPAFERYGLGDDQLRWMLRNMILQRTLDNRGFQLNRQGKIPFATGSEGHEGIHAGAALAFQRGRDVLVPYYRDMGLCVGVGMDPIHVLLSMFARGEDVSGGRQFPNHYSHRALGLLSISSIIAAHCSHAVGVAYAMKLRKETDRAVLCTFGDGATSSGEWHEAVNFAAVHRLPIVFLCENNEWAISTPRGQQMAIEHIIDKAPGYGLPGVMVDGSDPLATYKTVKDALDSARSGGGPTLVEATCYRFLSHTTDDDDRTYRTRDEIESHRHLDPVPLFERLLVDGRVLSTDDVSTMKKDVLAHVNELTDRAEALPYPVASELYTHVYEGAYEPWL